MSTQDPFGVLAFLHWNHDWNNYHFNRDVLVCALNQLEELGIGTVRIDILWSDVYRGPNRLDFSRYDDLIRRIRDHRLNILAVLQYNKIDRVETLEVWNQPPTDFYEFAAYVNATVSRFKSEIHHWEIWNEPNLPIYWAGPKDRLSRYCRLLRLSYAAAKAADPGCQVLNGGLTEPLTEDLRNFYFHGGKNSSDILNIHTFLNPQDPRSPEKFHRTLSEIEKLMDHNGDGNKKIWITEMGCPGVPGHRMPLSWFAGGPVDEATQAEWVKTQYGLLAAHPRIEKLFWAFYRDTDQEFKDATDYLGLVRHDLTPKPAFFKLKELIRHSRESGNPVVA